jgi:tetratricopeptide (TPR) repeat protein
MSTANYRPLILAALLLACAPAAGAADLAKAVEALQSGRIEQAEREFTAITREDAADPARRGDVARAYFYLGTLKQFPVAKESGDASRDALNAAGQYYESALAIDPTLGGALNNLARAQLQLGDNAGALATIDRAVTLKDGREAIYQATRADIVEKSGDVKLASAAAMQASIAAPQDESRRRRFTSLALKADPKALSAAVGELLKRGESIAAQAVILDTLPNPAAPREALMEYLADALTAQSYDARTFGDAPAGVVLQKLTGDTQIGAAARDLLKLHKTPANRPSAYEWWGRDFRDHGKMADTARARRLGRLSSSLAHWFRDRRAPEEVRLAIPYAELALACTGDSIDPRAVLDLAGIYGATGQRDRIRQMSDEYVAMLFAGKLDAYKAAERSRDFRRIYDFHMALGAIYGYLEQWTPQGGWEPASAIFQLEHVRSTAERINQGLAADSKDRLVVPASAIQLLAKAYDRTGQADKSVRLLIDEGNARLSSPNPRLASEVIMLPDRKPIDVSRASPALRADWEKLAAKVATLPRQGGGTF